jgi:hypothetical protein
LSRRHWILVTALAASLGAAVAAWASYSFKTFPAPAAKSTIAEFAVSGNETYFLAYAKGGAYVAHVSPTGETDVVRDFAPDHVAGLAASPNGTLSVIRADAKGGTHAVYRFQPGGDLTIVVPRIQGRPQLRGIVACNDREVWLAPGGTGSTDVVRLRLDGNARVYRRKGVSPNRLACGPKGTIWFTALHAPTKRDGNGYLQIGRISSAGKLYLFRLPTSGRGPRPSSGPIVQAAGGDAMWFGAHVRDGNFRGRITPAGQIKVWRISPKIANPNRDRVTCMAVGPDRNIWLGFSRAGIARIGDFGKIEKVPRTAGDCSMIADFRGNLWFDHGQRIGRIRP